MVTTDELKELLFEDDDSYQKDLAQLYITASEQTMLTAIGCDKQFLEREDNLPLAKVAILAHAGALYEYRTAQSDMESNRTDLTFGAVVSQLRAKYESEVDDDSQKTKSK